MTVIREYLPDDAEEVGACIAELQDFSKAIYPLMADGKSIARKYLAYLVARCVETEGRIFVAVVDGRVVGVICVFARVASEAVDEEPYEYAYISDLVVSERERGKGFGRALLRQAEDYARLKGARILRIGVLAENVTARELYLASDFREQFVMLQKSLEGEDPNAISQ